MRGATHRPDVTGRIRAEADRQARTGGRHHPVRPGPIEGGRLFASFSPSGRQENFVLCGIHGVLALRESLQPEPAWLPAVRTAERTLLGAQVRLHAFSPGRLVWQIRPGRKERAGWTADGALSAEEVERVLVAISLGVGFRKDNRRGLVLDGKVALPIRPDLGALVTSPSGQLTIGLSVADLAPPGWNRTRGPWRRHRKPRRTRRRWRALDRARGAALDLANARRM